MSVMRGMRFSRRNTGRRLFPESRNRIGENVQCTLSRTVIQQSLPRKCLTERLNCGQAEEMRHATWKQDHLRRNCPVGAAAAFSGQRESIIHGTGCAESTKNPRLCAKCPLCLKTKSKRRSRDYTTALNTTLQCWTFMRNI